MANSHSFSPSPKSPNLISIGTHSLHATITGPHVTNPTQPTVIIVPGAGATCESWRRIEQLIAPFARILLYDRSGLGSSEPSSKRPGPITDAMELSALLVALPLPGPYVLVAHSYGGCVAREFLHLRERDVAGMVLSETGTETKCSVHEEQYRRQVLGARPLSIIRGTGVLRRRVPAPEGEGKGAENMGEGLSGQQRKVYEEMISSMEIFEEKMKREQLQLSRNHRFRNVPGCGHCVHQERPEVVVEEIKWALENLEAVNTNVGTVKTVGWKHSLLGSWKTFCSRRSIS